MILLELLSSTYTYHKDNSYGSDIVYVVDHPKDDFEVIFFYKSLSGEHMVEFRRNGTTKLTGAGDQFKIFATVCKIIEEFVDKVKPKKLSFSCDNVRTSLYEKLAKKINMKMNKGPDYTSFLLTTYQVTSVG